MRKKFIDIYRMVLKTKTIVDDFRKYFEISSKITKKIYFVFKMFILYRKKNAQKRFVYFWFKKNCSNFTLHIWRYVIVIFFFCCCWFGGLRTILMLWKKNSVVLLKMWALKKTVDRSSLLVKIQNVTDLQLKTVMCA